MKISTAGIFNELGWTKQKYTKEYKELTKDNITIIGVRNLYGEKILKIKKDKIEVEFKDGELSVLQKFIGEIINE